MPNLSVPSVYINMNNNEDLLKQKNKIVRIRESKFSEKKDPYKKYQKAKWKWTDIFSEIDLLKNDKQSRE